MLLICPRRSRWARSTSGRGPAYSISYKKHSALQYQYILWCTTHVIIYMYYYCVVYCIYAIGRGLRARRGLLRPVARVEEGYVVA